MGADWGLEFIGIVLEEVDEFVGEPKALWAVALIGHAPQGVDFIGGV